MSFININPLTRAHMSGAYESAYLDDVLKRYKHIRENDAHAKGVLPQLTTKLTSKFKKYGLENLSVVAFGSYARLDASAMSDFDYLIITQVDIDEEAARHNVASILKDLKIKEPNPDGVFCGVVNRTQLENIFQKIGSKEDTYDSMSRRLLLLLESRAVIGESFYTAQIDRLIEIYGKDVRGDPRKNYVYLLNDLIRYFRTICVNYAFTKNEDGEKWPLRNIKLRHSRVIMYASLIAMLGVLSIYREPDKNERLKEFIRLTPLQRLHRAYLEAGDTGFYKVAGNYDVFLSFLNDEHVREMLKGLDYDTRYESREFSILKANSDALAAEISRFILDRRHVWADRFFEYLLL